MTNFDHSAFDFTFLRNKRIKSFCVNWNLERNKNLAYHNKNIILFTSIRYKNFKGKYLTMLK
jgi:hypothetical protein